MDPERKRLLLHFQEILMVKFKNLNLLNLALTHRSLSNESASCGNNERLEFLGDAILGAVTSSLLYKRFHEKKEGELAKIKAVVVSEKTLCTIAQELRIDTMLLLGHGEELSGGRTKKAILADAFEAIIGALYLDSGYQATYSIVSRCIIPEINRVLNNQHHQDYKSLLQELTQHHKGTYPVYRLLNQSGPEHKYLFWIEVEINGKIFGPATGRNKKSAEQEVAKIAYEYLSVSGNFV
ncbi:MAG: ribonuclease III [Spirochaetaceae bacterium]|jgi:ribonuclease-3|nr:ribonuclease III [Spirochaetaceae bacterium]